MSAALTFRCVGRASAALVALAVLTLCGCCGNNDRRNDVTASPAAERNDQAPSAVASFLARTNWLHTETGSIRGIVKYDGPQPAPRHVGLPPGRPPVVNETYVFGKNDTLQNVLVYISGGAEWHVFQVPQEPVVIEFRDMQYAPRISVALPGQNIEIVNRDATLHNAMTALIRANKPFNFGLPVKDMVVAHKFHSFELGIMLACAVHPWENGYIHVLSNPYFAVTGEEGTFEINDVPPGEYELSVRHEFKRFVPDEPTIRVKVEAGKAAEARFQYRVDSQPKPE